MNNIICVSEDTAYDEDIFSTIYTEMRNTYTTEPMPAIKKLVYHQDDEEGLHTSFEEAISDRLLALHSRLGRLSNPTLAIQAPEHNTDVILSRDISFKNITVAQTVSAPAYLKNVPQHPPTWKRTALFACFATMFILLGFDLMGLLVLHMH